MKLVFDWSFWILWTCFVGKCIGLRFSTNVLTIDSTVIKLSCSPIDIADNLLITESALKCATICSLMSLENNCFRFNFLKESKSCKLFKKGSTYSSRPMGGCSAYQVFVRTLTEGCPSGFTLEPNEMKCYGLLSGSWTWMNARDECNKYSITGRAVSVESKKKDDSLISYLTIVGKKMFPGCMQNAFLSYGIKTWLGGQRTDPNKNSEFVWKPYPNVAINFTYWSWHTGEPSYSYSNEACLALTDNFKWNDNSCSETKCGLCEADFIGEL